ncbi:RNA polymerase sigma factor [bacterium]|nr:RNA polymerase sigma factor [bacterium]MBU1071935.1 RNA polymerase sigma factor [bacterium]MBU1676996.1 RNA polymerase sigma factor [bacterium]
MGFWDYRRWRDDSWPEASGPAKPAAAETGRADPDLAIQKERLIQARIDLERFEYFYEQFYPQIMRFCYRNVWHRDEAEDLAAETFQAAMENLSKFRWQGISFGAWLYRIASNRIKKWHWKQANHPQCPLPENLLGEVLLIGDEPDPERRLEIAQECDRLSRYMSRLNADDRIYLNLHYQEGLSTREISVIADKKWGTIASRISRARKKLQALADEDDERS